MGADRAGGSHLLQQRRGPADPVHGHQRGVFRAHPGHSQAGWTGRRRWGLVRRHAGLRNTSVQLGVVF